MSKPIQPSEGFTERLKTINPDVAHSKIEFAKEGRFYQATFEIWSKGKNGDHIKTRITKSSMKTLENKIIQFLK